MAAPKQTYELEAVNLMLSSIGERPVNSLDTSQRLDVIRAMATLNETNLLVQSRGWWFNNETGYVISPDANGVYTIDEEFIRVDLTKDYVRNFVMRGKVLYNRDTFTTTGHTEDLALDFVRLLTFDDLPQTVRLYVARRAGVIFQTRSVGSPTLFEFTERDAQEAWGSMLNEELDHVDTNITHSPEMLEVVWNR
jgi:hypothetical protein